MDNKVFLEYAQGEGMFVIVTLQDRIKQNKEFFDKGILSNRLLLGVFNTLEECTDFYKSFLKENDLTLKLYPGV